MSARDPNKVYLESHGCQMNMLDSELILGQLERHGFSQAKSLDEAGVLLVNTCSVRAKAEEKVHTRLGQWRRLKRQSPELTIAVLGCMAQKEQRGFFERYPHVDLVVGTGRFPDLAELMAQQRASREPLLAAQLDRPVAVARDVSQRPTPHQAFIAVMRGCDHVCSFCVVPRTRGAEVSRPIADIVDEARRLADDGVREITLLGQTVNAYGRKFEPPTSLAALLEALHEVDGLWRLRFVTSHPCYVDATLAQAFRELPKLCPSLPMPAQSGSDRVLKAMKRGYTRAEYLDTAAMLRDARPDLAVASDWIVGFPGEGDEDFERSVSLLEQVGCHQSFIFRYSPRERTAALRLDEMIGEEVKAERNLRLLKTQEAVSRAQHQALIGSVQEVLVEGPSKSNAARLTGRTPHHRIAIFEGPAELAGTLVSVRITDCTALTLFGALDA